VYYLIKPASKIKQITILIADTDSVLRMKWRLKDIFRILRELIKIRRLACRAGQTNTIRRGGSQKH